MTTSVYMLWCTRLVENESHINLEYYLYCIVWETTRKSKQKTKNLFLGNTETTVKSSRADYYMR